MLLYILAAVCFNGSLKIPKGKSEAVKKDRKEKGQKNNERSTRHTQKLKIKQQEPTENRGRFVC
jgi:hypothetical protein